MWPYDQYPEMRQPYRKLPNGWVVDNRGVHLTPYPEVDRVLTEIHASGIPVAAASRTVSAKGASSLIELFGWKKYFKYIELYPGTKLEHFQQLKKDSKVDYHEMLFFDNDQENIDEISKIGVTCILVNARIGMTIELLKYGLDKFEQGHGQ